MTGPDANTQDTRPAVTTHPLLGVAGVFLVVIPFCHSLGEGIALSVGIAMYATDIIFTTDMVVSFVSKVPTQYRRVIAAPMEAK